MTITVRCWCGWEYEVGQSAANSFARCPNEGCRAWVRIPPEPLLHKFLGGVVDAGTLEASMPDLRKQGGRAEVRPAAPAQPASSVAERAATPVGAWDDDLPALGIEDAPAVAAQGEESLPVLVPEETAVAPPNVPPRSWEAAPRALAQPRAAVPHAGSPQPSWGPVPAAAAPSAPTGRAGGQPGLVITSLVLGAVSVALAMAFIAGWFLAIIPALLGIIFGIVGLVQCGRRRQRRWLAVTSVVLCVFALAWGPIYFYLLVSKARRAVGDLMRGLSEPPARRVRFQNRQPE
ncbi:MAG: hypothetical protein FJ290_08660 [Planctomycetes bacterium]|nr:hypothetical protein [Planctomycetota bacterium]